MVILPIVLAAGLVNHIDPSGPAAMLLPFMDMPGGPV